MATHMPVVQRSYTVPVMLARRAVRLLDRGEFGPEDEATALF